MKPSLCIKTISCLAATYQKQNDENNDDRHARDIPVWQQAIKKCEDVISLCADASERLDGKVLVPVVNQAFCKGLPVVRKGKHIEIDIEGFLNKTIEESIFGG